MTEDRRQKSPRNRDLARIHALKRDRGLDDGAYRELLRQVTGESSAAALDARQRAAVIARLQGHVTSGGHVPAGVSPGQWRYVLHLRRRMGMTDAHFRHFLRHITGLDHPRFLDVRRCRDLIAAMKRTLERTPPVRPVPARGAPRKARP